MNIFKKILKYVGIVVLLLIVGVGIYLYNSGPKFPEEADRIISEVINNPLPELVEGETGFAGSKGIKIWYENILPEQESKGVVMLVMGISADALGWPQNFISSFTEAGYQVIRYDHRGTGMSDWLEDYDVDKPYALTDMVDDAISVLDKLQIDDVHIVGISMGGMIAQQLAIDHPDRVQTLSSVMSSGNIFDDEIAPISNQVAYDLIKVGIKYGLIKTEKNMIKLHLASRIILMGDASYHLDVKELSENVLYNMRNRRGYNAHVSKQHQAAVYNSVSRYEELKALKMPTLIIHGTNDPFIPIEHGKKCARLVPQADSMWVDNMGHDIPSELVPIVTERIKLFFVQYVTQ